MMIRPLILIYILVLTTEKYCVLSNAEPRRRQGIFSSPYPSRPTLGPTSYLYNGYCGSFPGVKRPGRSIYSYFELIHELPGSTVCSRKNWVSFSSYLQTAISGYCASVSCNFSFYNVRTLSGLSSSFTFRIIRRKSNFAQVTIEYTYDQLCMYIKGSPTEIQTPTHWKLIGRTINDPPPVLSPSSILPPLSPHRDFILWRQNKARVSKCYYFSIFFLLS